MNVDANPKPQDDIGTDQPTIEAAWAVVDPVLAQHHPVFAYEPRTLGPREAGALTAEDGGWPNPPPEQDCL